MEKSCIYLDNNGTTATDPRVIEVVAEALQKWVANPSSTHRLGQEVRAQLIRARRSIAHYLDVHAHEILFCSGGTEALNITLRGLVDFEKKGHIITSSVEHPAVYKTVKDLESQGFTTTFLSPGPWGAIKADALRNVLRKETCLITLMAVNNETGVKADIEALAEVAQEAKVPFVVDGVAWMGKEDVIVPDGVTALCFSGHKFHAPEGIGFFYLRQKTPLRPLCQGGGQEYGRRPGTENISGILGLAKAIELLQEELPEASERMRALRDAFEEKICTALPEVTINGEGPRSCNTSNLAFHGIEGESLLMNLDLEGVAASHGSACQAGAVEPSRILLEMGCPREHAMSSVRFSLSRMTTKEEIERAADVIIHVVTSLKKMTHV